MYYSIRHITRFRYSEPVTESVMVVRMQPRNEDSQRCLSFDLRTTPKAAVTSFADREHNHVHQFDVPDRHTHLTLRAEALVEMLSPRILPDMLDAGVWSELDAMTAGDEYWDTLAPSSFARPTDRLRALQSDLGVTRRGDPLSTLRELNSTMYESFEYESGSTAVDSPIDEALASRHGVCQDYAHIMIALVRQLGIPCRYVSGYLYHRREDHDRSVQDATHAWVEALLPALGWVGFDPTNNLLAGDRHIRVAVGRDYADVPPTRGVFRGYAETELAVSVKVLPSEAPPPAVDLRPGDQDEEGAEPTYHRAPELDRLPTEDLHEQPQQ